ncbi:3-hydroxyacyl-[acyl-carrier-protein] dehydratase [Ulvibacter sp. MAR_2010_11]|uniref:3-hydroxyacyl-ACP dehydratase n=1 Tax=Ulvibacter sp. MAR_2010_11 TaxID=1250229 RepID=UPI000C2BB54C|nr:3-hydroxyacyl-ACP dehydratase [Ulvibacter sp. MAR_2010_11]PKA83231.1 3-hydroxyacyl-[acyl-carrier-protein] dehydratase [Ulvibacter sp. MAR_2010_11]
MLLQDFYTILNKQPIDENSIRVVIKLNKLHSIFKGHFPELPITPGVGMLQILKEISEDHIQTSLHMERLSNVKFLTLVDPNVNATLSFHLNFQKENKHFNVKNNTTFEDGTTVFKCSAVFIEK